ncbi:MAG: hypothetical protein QJR02_01175 [Sinobacteraceae bacterium]|nr:hypothetical protein [Nevskia sp.]MDI3258323.1 hypothetical protein [Nevskiaceae bacterium]
MQVDIAIERSLSVPLAYERVVPLLDDLEGTIRRFPKLKRLTRLGERAYLWEMQTIGSRLAKIAHDVSYAARYRVDPSRGLLSWEPLSGHGNARIEGAFRLAREGEHTRLDFAVRGELYDVPVPLMYRPLAPPFIQGKFTRLVDTFLERTRAALLEAKPRRQ